MSSNTLPVCPKTGSTSPSLTVHLCLHTAPLREIGNAPLATYLGHNGVSSTYWYLEATPVLLRHIARQAEHAHAWRASS